MEPSDMETVGELELASDGGELYTTKSRNHRKISMIYLKILHFVARSTLKRFTNLSNENGYKTV